MYESPGCEKLHKVLISVVLCYSPLTRAGIWKEGQVSTEHRACIAYLQLSTYEPDMRKVKKKKKIDYFGRNSRLCTG